MPNETDLIRATFKAERTFDLWRECCQQAIDCCRKNSIYLPKTKDPDTGQLIDDITRSDVCPATWDGFSCWPDSPVGLVAEHSCPSHVYFLEFTPICFGHVTKQCFSNGSWYVRNGHEWSNYQKCNGLEIYIHRMVIGSGLHLFSVVVIGPALLILGKMRQRFGTRRVLILRWLLFWLLLNGLFSATQKIGIILKVFHQNQGDERPFEAPVARNQTSPWEVKSRSARSASVWTNEGQSAIAPLHADSWMQQFDSSRFKYDKLQLAGDRQHGEHGRDSSSSSSSSSNLGRSRARRMLMPERAAGSGRAGGDGGGASKDKQSFLMVLFCWTISVGIKIGNMDYVNYLKDTQLDCWMVSSRTERVEDIAGWPYLALVLLNTALFVITLIIMCRFKKLPGSTRPETSLWGYFKAAGMLVFLYGAHYLLLAYTPQVEGCTMNQVWHYAMLFVDGIQGVAISLVFCYRTSAGKEVMYKWWKNVKDENDCRCSFNWCYRRRSHNNQHQRGLLKQNRRSDRSTRSSNSNCNGKDMATELSNVNANNF